jgi:hypothetical protein
MVKGRRILNSAGRMLQNVSSQRKCIKSVIQCVQNVYGEQVNYLHAAKTDKDRRSSQSHTGYESSSTSKISLQIWKKYGMNPAQRYFIEFRTQESSWPVFVAE